MNKRLLTLLALVCALTLTLSSAMAATVTYNAPGLGAIAFPDEFAVITSESSPSSAVFEQMGMDYEQTMELLSSRNIIADAIMPDLSREYTVTMLPNELGNLNDYSESLLMSIEWGDLLASSGVTVTKFEIYYDNDGQLWIRLWEEAPASGMTGQQYFTVRGGYAINVTMTCYSCEFTPELEKEIQTVVDSIVYQ